MTTESKTSLPDREVIAESTRRVLAEMVRQDPDSLTEDTRLFADLGLDSTNALELLMLIEDELGIRVDADTLEHEHLETIGSLADYLVRQAEV